MNQATATVREITTGARLAPPPAWADISPYVIPQTANPHFIANGVCVLLDDSQIDLCGPERAWYYRRAELVTAPAGAEQAAQFGVSFDPSFERLEVHAISVIRDGQRTEHAETAFFEVLRRERNLERLHFDGRLTLHVTLPDVRQGDVVETSYTRYGMRKSLGGRHSVWIPFEWGVGIVETRLRQRAPKHRRISECALLDIPAPAQTESGGIVDRRWRTFERPGVRFEPLAPPWVVQSAHLQFSEWRDWAEVASVFAPLYGDAGPSPDDLEAEIARIAAAHSDPAERAAAVLRFTQGAVRYLAVSMGEGGYTPRTLADICSTRYGDCKDKTKLFVHMAHRLGLDACPALVNTHDGYALGEWLPSGQAFDHCIVRLAVDSKVYWLDPTRQLQPSPLDKVTQCHLGWALPLRSGAAGLEHMPEPPAPLLIETYEQVTLGDSPDALVRYEWTHAFCDVRAEHVRAQFARDGAVGVFKAYADDVRRTWPKAQVVSQELVSDNISENVITVREAYEIADAWTHVSGSTYKFVTRDLTLTGTLAKLDPGARRWPVYLGQPGRRTRRVDVRTAVGVTGSWSRKHEGSTLSLSDEMKAAGPRHLRISQELDIKALTLPASEAETYRKVEADLGGNDLAITEAVSGGKFVGDLAEAEQMNPVAFWTVVAICGLVIALLVAAL